MNKIYIANPIYDTVFKHLMANNRVARFFIETIINQSVESITLKPQEQTYFKTTPEMLAKSGLSDEDLQKIENLSIIRYDFVAVIRTPEGYKKVLIEIQKARNEVDLMRFRTYLAEQYKTRDTITIQNEDKEELLPIITIYLLGFKLPEINAVAIHVNRIYKDIIGETVLNVKNNFIECLTHDSYVIQIPRIEGKTRTRLERLLSIFEQKYFIDRNGIRKEYRCEVDDSDIQLILDILYHTGADPEIKEEMETEWWSNELWDEVMVKKDKQIMQQQQEIVQREQEIETLKKQLADLQDKI